MASGREDNLGPAVFDAAASGNVSRLKELVRFKRFSKIRRCLSWRDAFDRTPLMAAAAAGHMEIVKLLVGEYGVDVEESKFSEELGEEFTPLVYSANVGHHKVVSVLLQHGAKVTHAFPLHRACFASSEGNLECVKLLVDHGADVNQKYRNGRLGSEMTDEGTALAVACETICPQIVQFLLEKGADPNIPDKKGNCPLHSVCGATWNAHSERKCRGACVNDGKKIVQMLHDHGAQQTKNGMDLTPFMILALTGNLAWFSEEESIFNPSATENVEALELLASHFLLGSGDNVQKGYRILFRAKELSQSHPSSAVISETSPYGDYKEPSNCQELEELKSGWMHLKVVALMIRGRLLSMEAKKYYLWQAIRAFADHCPRTPEMRQLALRALKYETELEVESGFFCGFAVESLLRHLDPSQVRLADSVLEDVVILLKLAAINLSPYVTEMDPENRMEAICYHRFKTTTIAHLLSIYANYPGLPEEDKEPMFVLIQQFVSAFNMASDIIIEHRRERGEASPSLGLTLFTVYFPVVARRRPGDEGNVTERMITILLKCGVDPCQVTPDGYTALHYYVKMCPASGQTETFRQGIVVPLVEWGCPILHTNPHTGQNVIDDCRNPETKKLLMDLVLPSLLQLTARVIRKKRISYKDRLPASITTFLDMNV
ncbi:protein fem-1 homolog A-like [Diadema antillarum]|uniref:protein fem-1 homolog A-like n=1 Tax=Diadema antillarum TaxID=105358 RepID=UPI003A89A3A4